MTPEQAPSLLSLWMTVTPGAGSISMTSVMIPARSDSGMLGEPEPRAGFVLALERPTLTGGVTAAQPGQIPRGSPTDPGHIHGQIPGSSSGRSGADPRVEPRVNPVQIPQQIAQIGGQIPSRSRRERAARRPSRQAAARTAPAGRRAGRRHRAGQPRPARRRI